MVEIIIDTDKCGGCGNCVVSCPVNSKNPETASGKPQPKDCTICVIDGVASVVNKDICVACGMCARACPFNAIVVVK